MNELPEEDENFHGVPWGKISLDRSLAKDLDIFLNTSRKEQRKADWHTRCMAGQAANIFFSGDNKSSLTFRLTASNIAASAYEELRHQAEVPVIRPSLVEKVRVEAKSLRANLPSAQYLPVAASTKEFRCALEALCHWTRPATAPTSRSGDACAIGFTLGLAKKFAIAFVEIPVEYIHTLVVLGWPTRSLSATWRVLPADVTEQIKHEVEIERAQVDSGRGSAERFIHAATTTRHAMSDAESEAIEKLLHEVERLRHGKRRFSSDAARLRALREIVQSFDDPSLVADWSTVIESSLQEFSD
jgi:hypothetical protein